MSDKVLRYMDDKNTDNEKNLQSHSDELTWKVVEIFNKGNTYTMKNEVGKTKITNVFKLKKCREMEDPYHGSC